MKLTVKREVEAKYVSIVAAVRYGDEDMPYDAPLRVGDTWRATIDLDTHRVENWPQGQVLDFYMKVCDQGTYTLIGADRKILVVKENDYVPNGLLPGEFGDYLAMKIDETGLVTNWKKNADLCNFSDD